MVIKKRVARKTAADPMEADAAPRRRRTSGPRKAPTKRVLKGATDKHVSGETIRSFGKRNMTTYAVAVNLERSVPDLYDGWKPVHRRIIWAASGQAKNTLVKTARVVGDTLGKYHPHGDRSVADAIETMVNMPTAPLLGEGNWGTMIDPAAAMRYTNMKLSAYGYSFLHPDYIHSEVTAFVPNYDDKDMEPVTLPAQLPNVLINGSEGIGVGITTSLPSFTPDSMIKVLERMLGGEKLQPVDFARTLKFSHKWGGQLLDTKENKKALMGIFNESIGSAIFQSAMDIDRDRKSITISDWPPGTNLEKFVMRIRGMPECQRCYNSDGVTTFTIECKPSYNAVQFDRFADKVLVATRQKRNFKINVTHRVADIKDGVVSFKTDFLILSVPQLILKWLRMRVALELKSLEYRIRKQEAAIAYSELLIYATDKLDLIFKAVRAADPLVAMQKLLKITEVQAKQILDLKLSQLTRMDQDVIKKRLKEQRTHHKQLLVWQKRPRSKILLDLADVKAAIERDRKFENTKEEQTLTVV